MQHKMHVTDVDHCRPGCDASLIVLPMATGPPMPRVRALNSPALRQGRAALRPLGTRLPCEVPPRTRRCPPGFAGVMVLRGLRKDRDEPRQRGHVDMAEQERGGDPVLQTRTGQEDGAQHPQRIHPQRPLAPVALLAALIPTLRTAHLGGLDRLTREARRPGGGCAPRCPAGPLAPGRDHLGPGPVVAPLDKLVRDRALGQHSMRPHGPLAPAPVQREDRGEDFPPIDLTRAPSSGARLGRWEHWCHDGPWLVRGICRICLATTLFLSHISALLC